MLCVVALSSVFQCSGGVVVRVECVGEEDVVEDVDVAAAGLVRVDGHHVAWLTTNTHKRERITMSERG